MPRVAKHTDHQGGRQSHALAEPQQPRACGLRASFRDGRSESQGGGERGPSQQYGWERVRARSQQASGPGSRLDPRPLGWRSRGAIQCKNLSHAQCFPVVLPKTPWIWETESQMPGKILAKAEPGPSAPLDFPRKKGSQHSSPGTAHQPWKQTPALSPLLLNSLKSPIADPDRADPVPTPCKAPPWAPDRRGASFQ